MLPFASFASFCSMFMGAHIISIVQYCVSVGNHIIIIIKKNGVLVDDNSLLLHTKYDGRGNEDVKQGEKGWLGKERS